MKNLKCEERWPDEWQLTAESDEGDRFTVAEFDTASLIEAHAAMTGALIAEFDRLRAMADKAKAKR